MSATPEMIAAMAVVEASGQVNGEPTIGMAGAEEAFDALVGALPAPPEISDIVAAMSDSQRMELFSNYCRSCGTNNPDCQCWNDE